MCVCVCISRPLLIIIRHEFNCIPWDFHRFYYLNDFSSCYKRVVYTDNRTDVSVFPKPVFSIHSTPSSWLSSCLGYYKSRSESDGAQTRWREVCALQLVAACRHFGRYILVVGQYDRTTLVRRNAMWTVSFFNTSFVLVVYVHFLYIRV